MDNKVHYCHGVEAALLKATKPVNRTIRIKATLRRLLLKIMPGLYLKYKYKIYKMLRKVKGIIN